VLASPFAELVELFDCRLNGGGLCSQSAAVAGEHCALTVAGWNSLVQDEELVEKLAPPGARDSRVRGPAAVASAAATVRLVVEESAFTNNRGGALCVDDQRCVPPFTPFVCIVCVEHRVRPNGLRARARSLCDFDWDFGVQGAGRDSEQQAGSVPARDSEARACAASALSPPGWRTSRGVDYAPLLRAPEDGGLVVLRRNRVEGGVPCAGGATPSGLCYNRPTVRSEHNLDGEDDLCALRQREPEQREAGGDSARQARASGSAKSPSL
jgi:hypothetical protein